MRLPARRISLRPASLLRARAGALVLAMLATLLPVTAGPAAAVEHPDPGVIRVQPAPGEVVTSGRAGLTGVLVTTVPVAEVTLIVDDQERPFTLRSLDGHNRRVIADLDLEVGQHVATIRFVDTDGRTAQRSWRFAAVDLAVQRLSGSDRIGTAVALSMDAFSQPGSAPGAVLATSHAFPDGLAAAPLAVAMGGPLLLSGADALSPATANELTRAVAPGGRVVLLGGSNALSDNVASSVGSLGFDVMRISGSDRTATAAAIARELPAGTTTFVTSALGFADGLAAGAPAARDGAPILLTDPDALSPATRAVLVERAPERVVIVGGPGAVSLAVEAAIGELVPRVDRVSGADRYATAVAVARAFFPDVEQPRVAIASGADFPDALAGATHAGALGIPLLLTPQGDLPSLPQSWIAARRPTQVVVYGGPRAVAPTITGQLRNAVLDDLGGPVVQLRRPAAGSLVNAIDTIELGLDRGLDLDLSTMYVTMDGLEVYGVTTQGDFNDDLVFQAVELPFETRPGVDHVVDVYAQAFDGERWRHVRWNFTYRKVDLGRGDSGAAVQAIQDRLMALGYWLGEPDGQFGTLTGQALMAFQKYEGLERSGSADAATQARLEVAARPVPTATRTGRWVEIDKTRQVMLFIVDGVVEWALNTSTGTEREFTRPDGSTGMAHTPEGWFTFFRQIDGMREADLGQMWRPKYFTNAGHAIHGSTSIPSYPASHGCARLSYPAIDFVWEAGLAPIGTPVLVHR